MHISTQSNTIIILTDQEACYTIKIVTCMGEAVYSGEVCSKKQRITISGLECGEYAISVATLHKLYKRRVIVN